MTDDRNVPPGFRKYGAPVPVRKGDFRKGDTHDVPPEDVDTEEAPHPGRDEGEGSRVPTGS